MHDISGQVVLITAAAQGIGRASALAFARAGAVVYVADFVEQGIRCNAICPGTVQLPSLDQRLMATGDYDKARADFIARQPMGRIGDAEEIAELAVYLARATYTTGQAVCIDGDWSL